MAIDHREHIARHIPRLPQSPDHSRVDELLRRRGLRFEGSSLVKHGPGPFTTSDCREYLKAVEDLFGDAVSSFARVNFILLGCDCTK